MKVFIQPDVAVCKSAILNKFSTHIFFIANSPVECGTGTILSHILWLSEQPVGHMRPTFFESPFALTKLKFHMSHSDVVTISFIQTK